VQVAFGQRGRARRIAITHEGGVVRLRTRIDGEGRFDEFNNTVGATDRHVRPVDRARQWIDPCARVIIRVHIAFHAQPQAKFGDDLSALEYGWWRRRGRDGHGRCCNIRIIRIRLTQKGAPIGKSCGFGRQRHVIKGNVAFFTITIATIVATVRMRDFFGIIRHERQGYCGAIQSAIEIMVVVNIRVVVVAAIVAGAEHAFGINDDDDDDKNEEEEDEEEDEEEEFGWCV
jgi:hypothetical protein